MSNKRKIEIKPVIEKQRHPTSFKNTAFLVYKALLKNANTGPDTEYKPAMQDKINAAVFTENPQKSSINLRPITVCKT